MATTDPTKDELKAQLDATKRDMEILATMVRERAQSRALRTRDAAVEGFDELSAEGRALLESAQMEGERLAMEASDTIRRNPMASIGIAFGLGWLIGAIYRR